MKHPFWLSLALMVALVLTIGGYAYADPAAPRAENVAITLTSSIADKLAHQNGPLARLTPDLAELHADYANHLAAVQAGTATLEAFEPDNTLIRVAAGLVVVDAVAVGDPQTLRADLEALGLRNGAIAGPVVSGWLPIAALDQAAALAELRFARPAYVATNAGAVTSQGDPAMNADTARTTYGVNGAGVTVGTLSDSYDCDTTALTRAAADVASGDLPAGVQVLEDYDGSDCIDEGRAMMQLIHDVAPGAKQQFRTAFNGLADFAQGIRDLAAAGSDVINDDIIYFAEPMFQDGIIAQAVDDVVAQGIPYFSSAGNNGRDSYESVFRPGQTINIGSKAVTAHDFDPGPGVDSYQRLLIPAFSSVTLVFQWDQPHASATVGGAGSVNDIDIYFSVPSGSQAQVGQQGNTVNIGKDPVEFARAFNNTSAAQPIDVVIATYEGANPGYLKYVIFGKANVQEFNTNSSTVYGHANARGAVAVGAAAFYQTPRFGVNPPLLEPFSSAGPTPIFFNKDGTRKSQAEIRQKPEIVAPDGTNTTFFGNDIPEDPDSFPNFFGTSAAAPHAAAVAALLLQARPSLTPAQILAAMQTTAIDMGTAGVDNDSGAGLIQADRALATLVAPDLAVSLTSAESAVLVGQTIAYTISVANQGNSAALTTTLTLTLPNGTSFVSASHGSGTACPLSGNSVTCGLGAVPAGGNVNARLVLTATVKAALTLTANVTTSSPESATANNSASLTVQAVNPDEVANLSLNMTGSAGPVNALAPISYTLTVANAGPVNATALTVTNTLPPGAGFVSASGTGWSCNHASGAVACTRASLAVGSAPPITINATTPLRAGSGVNRAIVRSSVPDVASADNSASVTTIVTPRGLIYQALLLR